MPTAVNIVIDDLTVRAELNDSSCAAKVIAALPIEAPVSTWGGEIYFATSLSCGPQPDARAEADVGELAFWPPGGAFCIFFGATPASRGDEPRAASPVNPIGRVRDDVTVLRGVKDGTTVRVERAS